MLGGGSSAQGMITSLSNKKTLTQPFCILYIYNLLMVNEGIMKTTFFGLLLTLGVFFFTNCSNDDDSSPTETLNGTWNLINIQGGIAGIDDDYDSGIIIWTFNNQNMTLDVANTSSGETIYSGFETGTYSYSIVENNDNNYILIDAQDYGGYVISDNDLVINQNEMQSGSGADGFILRFER